VQKEIEAILAPAKAQGLDAGCEKMGSLWCVWVGSHAGGRADGVSLAAQLMELAMPRPAETYTAEPEPVEIPAFLRVHDPDTGHVMDVSVNELKPDAPDPRLDLQAARIAELEAALAAAAAPKPEPMMANPPAEASDVIDWTAPPKDRQEALLVKMREVIGLIGLAEDRGGRADPALYRKRDALESGIRYNRATLAETI
jgi:hypothetical protein